MTTIGAVTERVATWNPAAAAPNTPQFDYIDLSSVDNREKSISAPTRTQAAQAPSRARQIVQAGDVLVSTVRPNLNAVAIVPESLDGATASTGFCVLRPSARLDGSYLFHWVKSDDFVGRMVREATGASYPAVSDRIVRASELPLPTIGEQRRIAATLDQVDFLRGKRRQALARLDDLTQSTFRDILASSRVSSISAGELMPTMRNGVSPSGTGDTTHQLLTLSAVTQGRFDPAATKIGMFNGDPPADKTVSASDFLLCRGNGNKALVGIGVYSSVDRSDLVFPDTVIAGRVDRNKVTLPYLEAAWRQPEVRRQIAAVARTTNGTFKVNQKTLAGVLVAVPPLMVQEEFGRRQEVIQQTRETHLRAAEYDAKLLQSLQQRAFAGQL